MVIYSTSMTAIENLVQEFGFPALMHEGAFRKSADNCPHCGNKMDSIDGWLRKEYVVEVVLPIDDKYGPIVAPERSFAVICECPKCFKKNIYHYTADLLLDTDFIDAEKINAELKRRDIKDSFEKTEEEVEREKITQQIKLTERLTMAQLGLGIAGGSIGNREIPEFSIPCGGTIYLKDSRGYHTGETKTCTAFMTTENSNPRWMTDKHLVASCCTCGWQRPIQDEIKGDTL